MAGWLAGCRSGPVIKYTDEDRPVGNEGHPHGPIQHPDVSYEFCIFGTHVDGCDGPTTQEHGVDGGGDGEHFDTYTNRRQE